MLSEQIDRSDVVPRGKEIYARIREKVETEDNIGKIISINVDTGDYEIDDDLVKSGDKLLARHPAARIYGARIGYNAVYGIGGTIKRTTYNLEV